MKFSVLVPAMAAASLLAAAPNTSKTSPTFYKDVLPVLQKNCQACHRPGEAAPMSLLTYESARPWAKSIKAAVAARKMPPWHADPAHGKFQNDARLSPAEITTIQQWVDSGAPAGDPKTGPKPLAFSDGWSMGKPDAIIEMPVAFTVPSEGTIDYQYVRIPTGFTEDRWVQIAEARPDDRAHVHHIIAFIREPGSAYMQDLPVGNPMTAREIYEAAKKNGQSGRRQGGNGFGDMVAGFAPGTPPMTLKSGQAKLIKAGSDIVLQMHYTANGKPGTDKSRVGLIFAKEPPQERVISMASGTEKFAIPPQDANYRVDATFTLQADARLISLLPHMHLRGKSFVYKAVYPTGESEILLNVPKYDFNWQLWYVLADQKILPAGTRIDCTAHYDNSPNNPANPDPTKTIKFGEQSWDEMMFGFFDVAIPADKSPTDLFRPKRQEKPAAD